MGDSSVTCELSLLQAQDGVCVCDSYKCPRDG